MPRIHDISLPIVAGGMIYPGNPPVEIELQQSMAKGGSSNVSTLKLGSHTATHVDAPLHMIQGAASLDQIPLDIFMGPATVVAFGNDVMSVTADALRATGIGTRSAERVLLKTRNSSFIRSGTFQKDYTYLAPDGAEYLVSSGVKLVGIDYLSIEQFHSGHHRTHTILLTNRVVILEGVDLSGVTAGEYELRCLPLSLPGLDGAPARAVLIG
jgi:arylformamidase